MENTNLELKKKKKLFHCGKPHVYKSKENSTMSPCVLSPTLNNYQLRDNLVLSIPPTYFSSHPHWIILKNKKAKIHIPFYQAKILPSPK